MNNTFNIQRLGLLLKRQWLEFGKIYLVTVAVALGVIITFYSFAVGHLIFDDGYFTERNLNFRLPLFLIFGFLFITVISSNYFAHLGQKPKAIIDLMIPASTFEKFVVGILFASVLSAISFTLIFYLTDLAFIAKIKGISAGYNEMAIYFFDTELAKAIPWYVSLAPLFVTSIFLLGSVYFNKFHYIKTAISVMIFAGIWAAIVAKSGELLFSNKILIQHERQGRLGWLEQPYLECYTIFILLLLTSIFWAITYLRLKEKQV